MYQFNTISLNLKNINQCKDNYDCINLGSNYTCVSVQTQNKELVFVSQCIQDTICSGNTFGNCPNFTNWEYKYTLLKPECSFTKINNCKNNIDTNSVDCYNSSNNYGIYKCVDANTITVNYNKSNNPTTTLPATEIANTIIPTSSDIPISHADDIHLMINIFYIIVNIILIILF